MIFFYMVNGVVVQVSNECPNSDWIQNNVGWADRNDIRTIDQCTDIADQITAITGNVYLASKEGSYFELTKAPKIGDDVSSGFNGDADYIGKVTKIGKNYSNIYVTDDNGNESIFRKKKNISAWKDGYRYLSIGINNSRNPHF